MFCTMCQKYFFSGSALKRHNTRFHSPVKCKFCDVDLACKRELSKHTKQCSEKKRMEEEQSPAIGAVTCEVCGAVFKNRLKLKDHRYKIHSAAGKEVRECDLCGKTFTQTNLNKHRYKVHFGGNEMRHCEYCGKAFTRTNLCYHIRTIHKVMHSKCDMCGKTFQNFDKLRRHQNRTCTKQIYHPTEQHLAQQTTNFSAPGHLTRTRPSR